MFKFQRENDAREAIDRRTHTVVLWHGQYSNDGYERLDTLEKYAGMFNLSEIRMEGRAGDWRIVADAYEATPARDHFTTTATVPRSRGRNAPRPPRNGT